MKTIFYTFLFIISLSSLSAQNYGLLFDGSTEKVELCNSEEFNIGTNYTVEAWIYASEWRPEFWQGSILSKDQQAGTSGWVLRAGKNGTLSFVVGVGSSWPEAVSDPFMNENQWYHVAAVKEGGKLQLFINGNLSATATFTGEPAHNNQVVTIGESVGFPGRQWRGLIDEVRVWDIARTQQEIADNQTADLTGNEPGLITYLPMNDGSSLSASNLALDNCDGTFVNMTESAWQEGYSIPSTDVGAVNITAPDVISIFTKPVKLRAEIQNFGSEAVSDIPVEVTINGLPAFSQTFNITLQPTETRTVIFDRVIDLSDNNTNLISMSAKHPEDANSLNDGVSYRYRKPQDGNIVNILNEERYNFGGDGQTKFTDINLPENIEDYETLLLHISLECPNTGCDPWDQPARISVETDQGSHEITRFITPYGQGCGPWTVDVTDFKSLLKGGTSIKSFIQVWGPSGWLVNLDLEYIEGDAPSYNKVTTLWETDNWVYGDPGISYDLPEQTISIDDNTETNHIRMTITGHGQGNTDNAAEFSNKSHSFIANGEMIDIQNLWKNDCAQNECANQAGTWTLSRAGWCPGEAVEPYIVNTTSVANPGESISLDYELQQYTNLLNTNYNNMGHTEPHYKLYAYFVESSNTRFKNFFNLRAEQVNIVTNGNPSNPAINDLIFTFTNTGTEDISNAIVSYYVNKEFAFEEAVGETIAAGETYTHSFSQITGFDLGDDNLVFAVVTSNDDQNLNDDATKASINEDLVSITEIETAEVNLSPNPSSGIVNIALEDAYLNGELLVIDILGRTLIQKEITSLNSNINLTEKGVYLFNFSTKEGTQRSEKIVIE